MVRGIQLSVGLSLAQKGVMLVAFRDTRHQHFREAAGTDSIWPGLIAAGFILVTTYLPVRPPSACVCFTVACSCAAGLGATANCRPCFESPGRAR